MIRFVELLRLASRLLEMQSESGDANSTLHFKNRPKHARAICTSLALAGGTHGKTFRGILFLLLISYSSYAVGA